MIGQMFGKLTVLSLVSEKTMTRPDRPLGAGRLVRIFECRCECGVILRVRERTLKYKGRKSRPPMCNSCAHSGASNSNHKHGNTTGRRGRRSETPEYRCWKSIKTRCYNKRYKQYKDYGGRGIKVCNRWLESFINFLDDMGPKPTPEHSIERSEVNGDYTTDNCYWATDAEQRKNRRTSRLITIAGRTQCLIDWLKELGVNRGTFESRERRGWSEVEALLGRGHAC